MDIRSVAYVVTILCAGMLAPTLAAQSTDGTPHTAGPPITDRSDTPSPQEGDQRPTVYVPSLDGTGLIAMDGTLKTHFLVGGTYSGGWDSNPDDLAQATSSGVYAFSPYVGVQVSSNRMQYVFQYQPTIRTYTSSRYAGGTMNQASAKLLGDISERWHWDVIASGSYGQDSIRLLAPAQTEAVGNVPGTSPGSASYLPNAGIVTYVTGEAGLHFDRSDRDVVELRVANAYNRYSEMKQTSSIATTLLKYQHSVSSTLSLSAYDQIAYYYGSINCASFGFGAGMSWKVRQDTALSLTGGPQLDSAACGKQQGFSYSATFNTRLSARSQIYATSARQTTTTYLGPGLWQQSAAAGYQRELSPSRTFGVDIGYVGSDALQAADSYHGTYFEGTYSHHLGHALTASMSYRNYTGNWGATNFSRQVALFSLSWTPGAGHLFQ